jgi:glyoxylase-like metal-dependent hydrolase (beta-lactamase superfamily II)
MHVKQFFDDGLAHGSYAILSDDQVALVDPGRDPRPYESFAEENNARIVAIFETHPHADFASSHMEFYRKYGLPIYVNPKMQVDYPHQPLDDGETVPVGSVTLKALFTPGHSPDHNTYLLQDEAGNPSAVFTGDSLFVGDIGRPDLREGAGKIQQQREELAALCAART